MLPVGPPVEAPVSAPAPLLAPATPDDGRGYDYAINDLLFRLAINNDRPYQRATAQFRKDQFDTGQQVGDQSLTGWWTRGQFSFHKGAGVTYYEVSEGETVANRYADAEGVYPWRPGQVTCQREWDFDFTSEVSDLISVVPAKGSRWATLSSSGVVRVYSLPATWATVSGMGTVVSITPQPAGIYALNSAGEVYRYEPGGSAVEIYNGLGADPYGIWFVKNRLIVNSSDGKWYQLAAEPTSPPVTVGSGDVIFTGNYLTWSSHSAVCDTPGPILVGNLNYIYALTVDAATGDLPTLSTPIQVAELPPRESVYAMAYHLGFLVLLTSAGVRIGVVADNGQVTYGPLLIEGNTAQDTTIGREGNRVLVTIDERIYEIDLSQQIGTGLEFAWTGRGTPLTANSPSASGIMVHTAGYQVAWNADEFFVSRATAADFEGGWLQTGFHRFATLERKSFQTVRVSARGSSGTITISKVLGDGTTISLYVLDVAERHEVELSLGPVTSDVLGLRFDLAPDSDAPEVSPELLGYQIRALPVPDRQRMIRVPVMLFDQERRQPAPAMGHDGWAWERLKALENLEQSNAVVSFRDYRTGEAGTAFIESIEFDNRTPPSSGDDGFGGIGWITLRKVS